MSGNGYGSGKGKFIGQSVIYPYPIPLDPAQHPGAAIVTDSGDFFFSDGVDWKIPTEDVDISRPSALVPTTSTEATQLRITTFRSPGGFTQTGIIFEINVDGVPEFGPTANKLTRTVTSTTASLYQVLYPDDGFVPGDTIWWRAKYLGTDLTQSEFSLPFAQTFPDLIATPTPVTRVNQIVGQVQVTPYDSPAAFGLNYFETQTEFYTADGVNLLTSITQNLGAITDVPTIPSMPEGASYVFRSRYGGRVSLAAPVVYSQWSTQRVFFNGAGAMLLEYNLDAALSRTVNISLGAYDATALNVTVNWGDGTTNVYTTGGVKSKVYAAGIGPIVNVSISGSMRQFGGGINNQGLKRVDNWGLKLGLTSLREALRNTTTTLEYVNPNLPTTVTNLQGLMYGSSANPASLSDLTTTNITNMSQMFRSASAFNRPIGGWDVSNVTNMFEMFHASADTSLPTVFNQDIGAWDVSKVTNMSFMFAGQNPTLARFCLFNNGGSPSISNWNVSSVTNMSDMFSNNTQFNQPIGAWNVSSVTNMSNMFKRTTLGSPFNQPLAAWNTSNVTNMSGMFWGAHAFNQPIGAWNTSKVTNMSGMFVCLAEGVHLFNQPIGTWDVSSVTTINNMFGGQNITVGAFNQPLNSWNTSNMTDMGGAFYFHGYNQPLSNWNTSKVTNMNAMFMYNNAFNQPIGMWDVSKVTNMNGLLLGPPFNQDISGWLLNVNVTLAGNGFGAGAMSNLLYSKMLTGWANTINLQDGPRARSMIVTAKTYSNTDFSADFPGKRFANAVAARAFMVGARSVSVAGASDVNANGTYLYNAGSLTYLNSTTSWYFIRVGNRWELRNGSNVVQATSNSLNTDEPYKETWTGGILAPATLLLAGAGWTISGDTLV